MHITYFWPCIFCELLATSCLLLATPSVAHVILLLATPSVAHVILLLATPSMAHVILLPATPSMAHVLLLLAMTVDTVYLMDCICCHFLGEVRMTTY